MRFARLSAAAALVCAETCLATHGHRQAHNHYGKRHAHSAVERGPEEAPALERRTTCTLPNDPDVVTVPGAMNGGFAMSPDVACTPGMYCPYACVPGKVMAQWQPGTGYVYPESMNGGVLCKDDGTTSKPFTDSPYCVPGTGTVTAVNQCGSDVSFCQTVLPGDESMLIPNDVQGTLTLAVPGASYWNGTAAHYYVNPPGTPSSTGCVWGTESSPVGNWSPYVAGANTDSNGLTFVKIAWNPIWTGCGLSSQTPDYGIKIECNGSGCNGMPCSIDPSSNPINTVQSPVSTVGVGGASFCVVTVPAGGSANIVVFPAGGGSANTPSVASSSSAKSSTTTTSTTTKSATTSKAASTSSAASSNSEPAPPVAPGIFHENSTQSVSASASAWAQVTASPSLSPASSNTSTPTSSKNDAGAVGQGGAAIAGLIVAFVATAWLY